MLAKIKLPTICGIAQSIHVVNVVSQPQYKNLSQLARVSFKIFIKIDKHDSTLPLVLYQHYWQLQCLLLITPFLQLLSRKY